MLKAAFGRTLQKESEIKKFDENDNETKSKAQSPVLRIHSPRKRLTPHGSPVSISKWSPAITQIQADDSIPFELPPSAPGRYESSKQASLETLNIPELARSRSMSLALFNHADEPIFPRTQSDVGERPSLVKTHQRAFSVDVNVENNGLGRIEPELYRTPESNCESLCGRIWFSLIYDGAVEVLTIKIIKIKQLTPRIVSDQAVARNCFVKVFLLPNEKHFHQTKTRHKSNNPVINETFTFQVPNSEIHQKTLRLSVFDEEKRKSLRSLLGHVLVNLNDVDFSKGNEEMWRDLDDIAKPGDTSSSLGDILIGLGYIPSAERLSVVVKEAKNLRKIDLEATGIFVRVFLYHGNNLLKTKKTSTKVGLSDPIYNESFYFKITPEVMEQTSLSFTVVTKPGYGPVLKLRNSVRHAIARARLGDEHKYGVVSIGSFHSTGEQSLHWQEILSQAPKSIAKWHALSDAVE